MVRFLFLEGRAGYRVQGSGYRVWCVGKNYIKYATCLKQDYNVILQFTKVNGNFINPHVRSMSYPKSNYIELKFISVWSLLQPTIRGFRL